MQSFAPSHGHNFTYSEETLRGSYSLFNRSRFFFSSNYSYHESPILVRNQNNELITKRLDSIEVRGGYLFNHNHYVGISTSGNKLNFETQSTEWAMGDTTLMYKYQLPTKIMGIHFALSPQVILPTGEKDLLLSDNSFGAQIGLIGSRSIKNLEFIGNMAMRYTEKSEYNNVQQKQRLISSLGFNYHVTDRLAIGPEYYQEYAIDGSGENFFKFISINSHYSLNRSSKLFASMGTGDITSFRDDHFRVLFGIKISPVLVDRRTINIVKEIPRGTDVKSVYFATNSTQITQEGKAKLQELVRGLEEDQKLHIIGQADKSGSEDYNTILSIKRALSVKNYLNELGLKIKAVDTSARGELFASKNKVKDSDRRVDVIIE